jgi:hypothetical protein
MFCLDAKPFATIKKHTLKVFENSMLKRMFGPSDTFRHAILFLDNMWQLHCCELVPGIINEQ